MRTHARHVLMCTGPRCTENGDAAQAMFALLGQKLDARPQLCVKRSRTHCMLACKSGGPLLVVYPEGTWYRCHDEAALEHIVAEHLEHGREATPLVFHRLGSGDVAMGTGAAAAAVEAIDPVDPVEPVDNGSRAGPHAASATGGGHA